MTRRAARPAAASTAARNAIRILLLGAASLMAQSAVARSNAGEETLPANSISPADPDPLLSGFQNPPDSARPWVWWHWMNGNVTAEGAILDLEWMKRAGIGGAQLFQGDLRTPQLVPQPLTFQSDGWKDAVRRTVNAAKDLKLGLSITTSPGWSETGGPWVQPEQAMKKLVWSSVEVRGGRAVTARLAPLPDVAGPYQDINLHSVDPWQRDDRIHFQKDVATVAVRIPQTALGSPVSVSANRVGLVPGSLTDGSFGTFNQLAVRGEGPIQVVQDFGKPVLVQSIVVGLPEQKGFGSPPSTEAWLEVSDDGKAYRRVLDLPVTKAPVRSASIAPTRARYFRLSLVRATSGHGPIGPLPTGAIIPPFPSTGSDTVPLSEFALSAEPRVNRTEEQAGFGIINDYYAAATPTGAPNEGALPSDVIDVSQFVDRDGQLKWTPPKGRWRIIRFGYSLTGHHNGPAPSEATGLEVDKLNARHVRSYLDTYLGVFRGAVGNDLIGKNGIDSLLSDSIEAGLQNWTDDMLGEFERRRGYSIKPWLPVLTGVIVSSSRDSDRFLWDFRRTISELLAENHYGTIANFAHEHGLKYYAEALESGRPQLGDDMEMRQYADVPMGANWALPADRKPEPTYIADVKGAASVAHIYGKDLVAAETFGAGGRPWSFAPRDLKSTADLGFALGVTRPVVHTSTHQPFVDGHKPGFSLATFLSQNFNRSETWAEQARPWTDYLARSAFLLQQGKPVADIALFYGEEAPITGVYGEKEPLGIPAGYDFDFVNASALRDRLSVQDGNLVTPTGGRYSVLVLGGASRKLTLATLRRLADFAKGGATIAGPRPEGSPSLADDDRAVAALIEQIWTSGQTFLSVEAALAARQLGPDWQGAANADELRVVHRRMADGEVYFVSNRTGDLLKRELSFRTSGKLPELWNAETGQTAPATWRSEGGRTIVSLALQADDAVFVVFRKSASVSGGNVAEPARRPLMPLSGSWQVRFQHQDGTAKNAIFDTLSPWNESSDPQVKYFSGTATYTKEFTLPRQSGRGTSTLLDLGEVRDLAEVWVNGRKVATLWRPPYRLDISGFAKAGRNKLEIKVTNVWMNRLIGDAQPGAAKVTFTQGPIYGPQAPLKPSGMLGPVQLLEQKQGR